MWRNTCRQSITNKSFNHGIIPSDCSEMTREWQQVQIPQMDKCPGDYNVHLFIGSSSCITLFEITSLPIFLHNNVSRSRVYNYDVLPQSHATHAFSPLKFLLNIIPHKGFHRCCWNFAFNTLRASNSPMSSQSSLMRVPRLEVEFLRVTLISLISNTI